MFHIPIYFSVKNKKNKINLGDLCECKMAFQMIIYQNH